MTFLTIAGDYDEFLHNTQLESRELGLQVEEVVWAEPLKKRLVHHGIEDYLLDLAEEVRAQGGNRFGRFHAWDQED